MNRGFTVVEVLVTLIVIGILLGLGTVGLRATLANGRDSERKSDIETIARGLEQFYDGGVPGKKGAYPSYNEIWFDYHQTGKPYTDFLPGTTAAAIKTPTGPETPVEFGLMCIFASPSGYWATQPGCETPGIMSEIRTRIIPDKYAYEAIDSNGGHCYNPGCTSYNLYWFSEVENKVMTIRSKHS